MTQLVVPVEARVSASSPDASSASAAGGGPRQQWMDVTFADAPVGITHMSFFNYYCAAITISHTTMALGDIDGRLSKQAEQMGMRPAWTVVVPKLTLMADPHCEDDAQSYHELTTAHFMPGFDHRRVTRLRICCLQPSPAWREYGLRELRFYRTEVAPTPPLQPTPNLTAAERDLAATVLEQIVGLGQIASEIRMTMSAASASSHEKAHVKPALGGSSSGSSSAGAGSRSNATAAPPRTASLSAASRRLPADHPSASPLAPYLVGEWNDELRLTGLDSARPHAAKPPPHEAGLAGGGGLYGGGGGGPGGGKSSYYGSSAAGTAGSASSTSTAAALAAMAMAAELRLDG